MNPSARGVSERTAALRRVWGVALGLFVLAGLTGALFRFAVAFVWGPDEMGGLVLGNVRHAHSHLMYFGWATPALMALMVQVVRRRAGRLVRGAGVVLAVVLGLALLTYPPFLLWGYAPANLGGTRLPLSVMAAGFNVLGWYAFVVLYARALRGVRRDAVLHLFDLALFFLMLSTFGAWGLPLAQVGGWASEPLMAALTHLFLDVFSEGWFVLGVLGLAYAAAEAAGRPAPVWPVFVAAAGVPFTFALALPAGFVPPPWKVLASVGGACLAAGLLGAVVMLTPRMRKAPFGWLWRFALVLLALKAVGQLAVALMPGINWAGLHGLRVVYLHLMLLGFVTLGLFTAAATPFGTGRGTRAMALAVGLLLVALLPLTRLWPDALGGSWALYAAAVTSLVPVLAGMYALGALFRAREVAVNDQASDPTPLLEESAPS